MATQSTLLITLNSTRTLAQLAGFIKSSTDARGECRALQHLFERLQSGNEAANFTVQTSGASSVRASGTVTLTNASIANNDTLTIAGVAFTAKTSGATGAQFNIGGTATITAANIVAAVNANATAAALVNLTSAAGVVTVTAQAPGAVGNFITLATSNGTGFALSAATLASGAGGAASVPVSYIRGA